MVPFSIYQPRKRVTILSYFVQIVSTKTNSADNLRYLKNYHDFKFLFPKLMTHMSKRLSYLCFYK